jgi:hypothetical protein
VHDWAQRPRDRAAALCAQMHEYGSMPVAGIADD